MRRAVNPLRLDRARPPLRQLIRESWIWRGEQPLDGLCCLLDGGDAAQHRSKLLPYLDHAETVWESPDAIVLLFRESKLLDCNALGPVLPLRRIGSTLTSCGFKPPAHAGTRAAIADSVLVMTGGELLSWPLTSFEAARQADWIDVGSIAIEQTTAPTRRRGVPDTPGLQLRGDPQFQTVDVDAGLRSVREAVARAPEPRWWERVSPGSLLALVVGAAALVFVLLLTEAASTTPSLVPLIVGGLAVALGMVLVRAVLGGRAPPPDGAQRHGAGEPSRGAGTRGVGGNAAWLIAVLVIVGILTRNSHSPVAFFTALLSIVLFSAVLILLHWLAGRLGMIGQAGAAETRYETYEPAPKPRRDSAFLRWLQKVLQNTPLTDLALGKYDRRVRELQRLFEQGRTEEALKKGLALGSRPPPDAGLHADAPIAGPGIRKSLEIEAMHGEADSFLASLPFGAREALEELYREQAQRCVTQGDVEHAAFIYAELLEDAEAAVQVFADAGHFETAAKLAQGRRLAPEIFISLWYRAGRRAQALRLAERHDAYEMLLLSSEPEDEAFRNEVRRVWSERLASIGDFGRALAVTETLVEHDRSMQTQRLEWMAAGLALPEPDADVLVRALKALPDDDGHDISAMSRFDDLLELTNIDAARRRKAVAEFLLSPEFEPQTLAAYRRQRLPYISDRLTRRMIVDHANFGLQSSIALLGGLANAGGQMTLAADIRRLPPTRKGRQSVRTRTIVLGPSAGAARVVSATPMLGDHLLIANDDGRLRLLDDKGGEVWWDQVWSPQDVVPIHPGRHALIIRNEPAGRRLSLFDCSRRRHVEIGPLALEAWATTAGAEGWLVYAHNQVLNLRIDPLLSVLLGGSLTSLEHHWATPITIDGRVRGLTRMAVTGEALWLFERTDKVLELWTVTQSDLRVRYNMLAFSTVPAGPSVTADLRTFAVLDMQDGPVYHSTALAAPTSRDVPPVRLPQITVRGNEVTDAAHKCLPVTMEEGEAPSAALVSHAGSIAAIISFDGASVVQMREVSAKPRVVLWDDLGRVIEVSTGTTELRYSNVSTREFST